ncbi:MAG: EamA/RhaT family transporter, partial [Gemmobacter sp.]
MRPLRGILYKIASVLVFTVLAVLVKATSGTFPPGQQVFFRSLFALPVIVVWLMLQGDLRAGLRTENPL